MSWDWTPELRDRLGRFLSARDLTGAEVTTRRIGDGHSNLTYLVGDGERQVVVRRPPPPPLPPGAHDMLREARLIRALAETPVPVPRVLATADAGELLDVPCYVMSYAEGPVVTTSTPPPLDEPGVRQQVAEDLVDVLVELHAVDWEGAGLTGRPEGFNHRHLESLGRLVRDDPPPGFAELREWLEEHAPAESGAAIVHNDFRIGNVVLAADRPGRVVAVLDWELATIGDPLFDLGYFLASVPERDVLTATEELGTAMLEEGYPTRSQLAQRYARRTGCDLSGLPWYVALAQWKLAALYEYQRRRGTDAYYDDPGLVAAFVSAGHRAAGIEEHA
jgi:aminoglycoside phosphotransferase (APT) family kinase protein